MIEAKVDYLNLDGFETIQLSELNEEFLLSRNEQKFFFSEHKIPLILSMLKDDFKILEVNQLKSQAYFSHYLDTEDLKHYKDHHNGRKNRYKIRFRDYVDSEISFLEIKHKLNSGMTVKERISIDFESRELNEESNAFLADLYPGELGGLSASIETKYDRMSFISNSKLARITLDTNVVIVQNNVSSKLENIAILELKYDKRFSHHSLRRQFKGIGILPDRISKYCIGVCYMYETVKKNNFKSKLRRILDIQENNN